MGWRVATAGRRRLQNRESLRDPSFSKLPFSPKEIREENQFCLYVQHFFAKENSFPHLFALSASFWRLKVEENGNFHLTTERKIQFNCPIKPSRHTFLLPPSTIPTKPTEGMRREEGKKNYCAHTCGALKLVLLKVEKSFNPSPLKTPGNKRRFRRSFLMAKIFNVDDLRGR